MKVFKRLGLTGAVLLIAASVTACAGNTPGAVEEAPEGELTTVRLVSSASFNSGMATLAVHGDFPADHGLVFEPVTTADAGASNQIAALLAGSADVGSIGINAVVDAIMGGAELQVIGGSSYIQQTLVATNDAVARYGITEEDSPRDRVAKLRGATIGAGPSGSSGNMALRAILADAGLDADVDVTLVPLADTSGSVTAGLENNLYDATFAPIGSGESAVLRGAATTLMSVPAGEAEVLEGNINSVWVAPTKLIEEQPELIERIREAFRDANNLVVDDPDTAKGIIHEQIYSSMDPELFDISWEIAKQGYPIDAIYGENSWDAFVRIYTPLSEHDYTTLNFADIVNPIATK